MTQPELALLTNRYDQWLAHCRDWVTAQSDEDLATYAHMLMDGLDEANTDNHRLTCHFALVGFVAAWLAAEEE